MSKTDDRKVEWAQLLEQAVTVPGTMAGCYRAFHDYSLLNQLEVMAQCQLRGIKPGPLATYKGWLRHGRHVLKGEHALSMWMPRTGRREETDPRTGEQVERVWTWFVYKPYWFVVSQTDGDDYTPEPVGDWDATRALQELDIKLVDFTMPDGNCQGYAVPSKRQVAVNPLAQHGTKTLLHEIAHVLLHGDNGDFEDGAELARTEKEMEAEAVALLVGEALGLDGEAESRGYIQHWYGAGRRIEDANAQRIIGAASKVLSAGVAKVRSEATDKAAQAA